jgi:RNA-binding protein YhbY
MHTLLLSFLLVSLQSVQGFVLPRSQKIVCALKTGSTNPTDQDAPQFSRWTNPEYSKTEVDAWWTELGDAMVSVGEKGLQPSHVNTVLDLLCAHERVRVKFSSDKMDQMKLAETLVQSESLAGIADLLDVRKRGLMIGRRRGLKHPKFAESKRESHGLCLDHFSVGHSCKYGNKCKYSHEAKLTASKRVLLLEHMGAMKPKRVLNEELLQTKN